MAEALDRDLRSDRLTFDELGWRGLWAYVTAAPPGTAIHHARCESWGIPEHLAAELLFEIRKLNWRYGAIHFEGGSEIPYPEQIARPGVEPTEPYDGPTWETATLEDLASPQVIAMLKGE